MPWAVEQNTGVNTRGIRCVYFNGYIYAFPRESGVWRRDGVGPWVQVFAGGGTGNMWDNQLWCTGGAGAREEVWRSEDGVVWVLDVDLNTAFGVQGSYNTDSDVGGYGDYLYLANYDVTGAGATYFYRRDRFGNWDMPVPAIAGTEGSNGRSILPFGIYVYWTNSTRVRRWGSATGWIAEPTLDGRCGTSSYISVIDSRIFIGASATYTPPGGGYYARGLAEDWELIPLGVPDNTWSVTGLSVSGDGEPYTYSTNGTIVCVYRLGTGDVFDMVVVDSPGLAMSTGAIGTEVDGTMYWAARAAGTLRFFAFTPNFNVAIAGLNQHAMDCDADGRALWVGMGDAAGQPLLLRAALPLTADTVGGVVYQPGAGDAINVKCSNIGNHLVISGNFGNNEQVRYTEDGIATVDMDPGNWGAETAQPLLIDADSVDEVMVALETAQDIMETFDQGASPWIQEQAAVGYAPSSMAWLGTDGDEVVVGSGAGNQIDYSPNRGRHLANITDSFIGIPAALEVA